MTADSSFPTPTRCADPVFPAPQDRPGPWPPGAEPSSPVHLGARRRPRWWISAVLATVLGVLGVPALGITFYLFYVALPLGLVVLATVVTVCLAFGRTRPDADAAAVGVVVSLLVAAALAGVYLAAVAGHLP